MYTPETFAAVNREPNTFEYVALAQHDTGSWRAYATRRMQHYADGSRITDPDDMTSEDIVTARRPAKPKEWRSLDSARQWLREHGYSGPIKIRD